MLLVARLRQRNTVRRYSADCTRLFWISDPMSSTVIHWIWDLNHNTTTLHLHVWHTWRRKEIWRCNIAAFSPVWSINVCTWNSVGSLVDWAAQRFSYWSSQVLGIGSFFHSILVSKPPFVRLTSFLLTQRVPRASVPRQSPPQRLRIFSAWVLRVRGTFSFLPPLIPLRNVPLPSFVAFCVLRHSAASSFSFFQLYLPVPPHRALLRATAWHRVLLRAIFALRLIIWADIAISHRLDTQDSVSMRFVLFVFYNLAVLFNRFYVGVARTPYSGDLTLRELRS